MRSVYQVVSARVTSCREWNCQEPAFTVSGESDAGFGVFPRQIGKIIEYFLLCHLVSQILKHFIRGDSQTAHARLAAAFVRINRDVVFVIHGLKLSAFCLARSTRAEFQPAAAHCVSQVANFIQASVPASINRNGCDAMINRTPHPNAG